MTGHTHLCCKKKSIHKRARENLFSHTFFKARKKKKRVKSLWLILQSMLIQLGEMERLSGSELPSEPTAESPRILS